MAANEPLSVVILAAGRGTRMRNDRPKVLHAIAGRSLIGHVLATAQAIGADRLVVVLGRGMEPVAAEVERLAPGAAIVIQDPPKGTGHALQVASDSLPDRGDVLVLYGDTPLLLPATLGRLLERRRAAEAAIAVLGMHPPDPAGYGRLRADADGRLFAIVEHKHCDAALLAEGFCNSGVLAFAAERLPALLNDLPMHAEGGEIYLTDAIGLAVERGWPCVAVEGSWIEGQGVNTQAQLAQVGGMFQERRRSELLDRGVIMEAPETVFLAADTRIGPGALIEPFVVFGPEVTVEAGAVIRAHSHLTGSHIGRDAEIGPFVRLRPGVVIGEAAKLGNFVEAKNSRLAPGAKAGHLSYLGDCDVGAKANIGAGTITCNYDGFKKHRTRIGAGAFIGSNTALIAPVVVGDEAVVAAGSVVTGDVPDDAIAVARPPQRNLEGAARRRKQRLSGEKPSSKS